MKISTLIIENERISIILLKQIIKNLCPEIEIVAVAKTALEGIKNIQNLKPDLVLLEVNLPDADGFYLLDCFPEQQFKTILMSTTAEYAAKAFQYKVNYFIEKPIKLRELRCAISTILSSKYETNSQIGGG